MMREPLTKPCCKATVGFHGVLSPTTCSCGRTLRVLDRQWWVVEAPSFDPDWVVAPGETLAEWFQGEGDHSDVARAYRAQRFGIRGTQLTAFLAGGPLDNDLAVRVAAMTSVPLPFWLALEQNFRVGLAAGKTWARS